MTPLERASRALVNNYPLDGGESPLSWEEVLPVARAVLQAIREPSSEIVMAAYGTISMEEHEPRHVREMWSDMIDAALEAEPLPASPVEHSHPRGGFQNKVVR